MSDRCYMEIQCSKEHYESVLREYFIEILEEDGDYVKAADPEANYSRMILRPCRRPVRPNRLTY